MANEHKSLEKAACPIELWPKMCIYPRWLCCFRAAQLVRSTRMRRTRSDRGRIYCPSRRPCDVPAAAVQPDSPPPSSRHRHMPLSLHQPARGRPQTRGTPTTTRSCAEELAVPSSSVTTVHTTAAWTPLRSTFTRSVLPMSLPIASSSCLRTMRSGSHTT
jgi:hypothetical protein